jgi:threonine dehydratase
MSVTFEDVLAARDRIAGGVVVTPCGESPALSELTHCRVYPKAEYLQRTGSFKERGARNALLLLPETQQRIGVIAASAGNHALALAFHGKDLGIPVTVVMPKVAPIIKQSRCRALGAKVLLYGDNIGEAKDLADQLVQSEGLAYVHGFDGAEVIAGAGTLGLEILDQVPEADAIVVPVGGGGLIAGLGLAVKRLRPQCEVIGVETLRSASFTAALECGTPTATKVGATLADGLAVPCVGSRAFELARKVVDRTVRVDEEAVALAILRLVELEKGVVEGAGATPLAALLAGELPDLEGKKVVLCLCGGNIDPTVLGRVIEHGLAVDGRLARFTAVISDRPGGLAHLTGALAEAGASIKQIVHERAFASADVSSVEVQCIIETRDRAHLEAVLARLQELGMPCRAG